MHSWLNGQPQADQLGTTNSKFFYNQDVYAKALAEIQGKKRPSRYLKARD